MRGKEGSKMTSLPRIDWLDEGQLERMVRLEKLPAFKGLVTTVESSQVCQSFAVFTLNVAAIVVFTLTYFCTAVDIYFAPIRGPKYCHEHVCVSICLVCLSVCLSACMCQKNNVLKLNKIFCTCHLWQ